MESPADQHRTPALPGDDDGVDGALLTQLTIGHYRDHALVRSLYGAFILSEDHRLTIDIGGEIDERKIQTLAVINHPCPKLLVFGSWVAARGVVMTEYSDPDLDPDPALLADEVAAREDSPVSTCGPSKDDSIPDRDIALSSESGSHDDNRRGT